MAAELLVSHVMTDYSHTIVPVSVSVTVRLTGFTHMQRHSRAAPTHTHPHIVELCLPANLDMAKLTGHLGRFARGNKGLEGLFQHFSIEYLHHPRPSCEVGSTCPPAVFLPPLPPLLLLLFASSSSSVCSASFASGGKFRLMAYLVQHPSDFIFDVCLLND